MFKNAHMNDQLVYYCTEWPISVIGFFESQNVHHFH